MSQNLQNKSFYTTAEAARLCNVSPSTIFRAIRNKQIKAFSTPGGHFRIEARDLENFAKTAGLPYFEIETQKKKILIVEDNPVELRLIKRLLEKELNLDIRTVESGFKAGFVIQMFKPDVIILDIYLGDKDGREIIDMIRSDEQLKDAKIIAVTGAREPKEIADIKKSDINLYIPKPVNPKTFMDEIRQFI